MPRRQSGTKWREKTEPLLRGDSADAPTTPVPTADRSIVRHILFLEGAGRATPYHSTTEVESIANRFAGRSGRIYRTTVARAKAFGVTHISRIELLRLLRGNGQGDARWPSVVEVLQARRYVEQSLEHLLDFSGLVDLEKTQLAQRVDQVYGEGA